MSGRPPRPPDLGPRRKYAYPKRADFTAYAIVYDDRLIFRTPYRAQFVEEIKAIPSQARAFVKDGRPLESALRKHLEENEDYFSANEALADTIDALVRSIAASNGLSDAWVVALAAPELFEFAMGAALRQYPDISLYDVRVLDESARE
jgi:hypothetical protein